MSPAAKKWTVYRRGEPLGTFTAAEIREQLRQGVLSPGDFASAEGSSVQQEIIDIDAIFGAIDEAAPFLADSPRRSRWAKKAEDMNLKAAPPTRARRVRLQPPNPGHGRRPAPGYPRPPRTGGESDVLVTTLIVLVGGALAAFAFWLLRNRS